MTRATIIANRLGAAQRARRLACWVLLACSPAVQAGSAWLAAGADHSLVRSAEGGVYTWGDDSAGQLGLGRALQELRPVRTRVATASPVQRLAAGAYHTLALTQAGAVLSWGNNAAGELGDGTTTTRGVPLSISGLPPVRAICAGEVHSAAVDSTGQVWAWGSNADGQAGLGSLEVPSSPNPQAVAGLQNMVDVRCGRSHTLVLDVQGQVHAWGANYRGQLGDGTGRLRLQAVAVLFPEPSPVIVAIAAVADQSYALDTEGRLWSWGENEANQLGDSSYAFRTYPLYQGDLAQAGRVQAFDVGPSGGAAILDDGSVWRWGFGGQFPAPERVPGLSAGVTSVQVGDGFMLLTTAQGQLLGFGDNQHGQLATGDQVSTPNDALVAITGLSAPLELLDAGYYHAFARDGSGQIWAWGDNTRSQLGNGVATYSTVAKRVSALANVRQVAAGAQHSLALLQDGSVMAWGNQDDGAVGDGSQTRTRTAPVPVTGLSGIERIAAAGASSAALDAEGRLWTWGMNLSGQLAHAPTVYRAYAPDRAQGLPALADVVVGRAHMLGLDRAGQVWAWGSNGYGQLGDALLQESAPRALLALKDVRALAAGGEHSLALDAEGAVWAWGNNAEGQVGVGAAVVSSPQRVAGLPAVVAIAAGELSSYALDTEGQLWAWGRGEEGQLGQGLESASATPVLAPGPRYADLAAGVLHALALATDGRVWAQGLNYSGQLGDGSFVNQLTAAPAVDAGLKELLDLLPTVPNAALPPGKTPPFLAQTDKLGNDRQLTLSVRLGVRASTALPLARPRAATPYQVFVAALVPGGSVGAAAVAEAVWMRAANGAWGRYLGGALPAYLSDVFANDEQSLLLDILESTDLSTLVGTRFFVGYGTSAEEMLLQGRVREVYRVLGVR